MSEFAPFMAGVAQAMCFFVSLSSAVEVEAESAEPSRSGCAFRGGGVKLRYKVHLTYCLSKEAHCFMPPYGNT